MSLGFEWFRKREERLSRYAREGVTQEEARSALDTVGSTVWPIAEEMAGWLSENWTFQQIRDLGRDYERMFLIAVGYKPERSKYDVSSILRSGDILRHIYGTMEEKRRPFVGIYDAGRVTYGDVEYKSPGEWLRHVRAVEWRRSTGQSLPDEQAGHFDGPWYSHASVLRSGAWQTVEDLLNPA